MSNRNQSKQSNMSHNNLKTALIKVPPQYVKPLIGRREREGAKLPIQRLAASVGDGCRIQALREDPGTFRITAYNSLAIQRAKLKLRERYNQLKGAQNQKPKKKQKPISKPTSQSSNAFSLLGEGEEEREERVETETRKSSGQKQRQQRHKQKTLEINFSLSGNSIRDRKRQNWLTHHATEEQKAHHAERNTPKNQPVKQKSLKTSDFPALSGPIRPKLVSAWAQAPVSIREAPSTPVTPDEPVPNHLEPLKKGHIRSKSLSPVNPFKSLRGLKKGTQMTPPPVYDDEDAFSEPEPIHSEDESDWGDEEEETWDSFADEEDFTLVECA